MPTLKFTKMHGLGNDFIVIDGISSPFDPASAPIAAWADRHTGIGFDQLLLVERPTSEQADFRYRIFNADGGEVEQCGNGARCFARFVADKGLSGKQEIRVETARGIIVPKLAEHGLVTVNMGKPRFRPSEIPFLPLENASGEALQYDVHLDGGNITVGCVNMGNPHAVLTVENTESAAVAELGAQIEPHPQFPEKVNVGFMQILNRRHIKLRVFERGVGETRACGTGACAAAVYGVRAGWLDEGEDIRVSLPGGDLLITWQPGGDVFMTGPAETVFEGELVY